MKEKNWLQTHRTRTVEAASFWENAKLVEINSTNKIANSRKTNVSVPQDVRRGVCLVFYLRVLLLSKLKKRQYLNIKKKNYFIHNYNFFHTLLTMF